MIKTCSYWSMKDGLANTHPLDRALAEAKDAGFEALELCIAPAGVASRNSLHEQFWKWTEFDTVEENHGCLLFWYAERRFLGYILPASAFESPDAWGEFSETARSFHERANSVVEELPGNAAPRPETGNPYQPPWEQ